MRLLRLRLHTRPPFSSETRKLFLRPVSFCPALRLFASPCNPRRRKNAYTMRTKCAQKRECHFSTSVVATTYNFEALKCTHFHVAQRGTLLYRRMPSGQPSAATSNFGSSPENVTIMSPFLALQIFYSRHVSYLRTHDPKMVTFSLIDRGSSPPNPLPVRPLRSLPTLINCFSLQTGAVTPDVRRGLTLIMPNNNKAVKRAFGRKLTPRGLTNLRFQFGTSTVEHAAAANPCSRRRKESQISSQPGLARVSADRRPFRDSTAHRFQLKTPYVVCYKRVTILNQDRSSGGGNL
jgi:hypothetical protein